LNYLVIIVNTDDHIYNCRPLGTSLMRVRRGETRKNAPATSNRVVPSFRFCVPVFLGL